MLPLHVSVDRSQVAAFCQRWKAQKIERFGSVLRQDFGPDSDIDLLITPSPAAAWSLLDHVSMQEELSMIFGRKVDLVSRRAIEHSKNHFRREAILGSAQLLHASG